MKNLPIGICAALILAAPAPLALAAAAPHQPGPLITIDSSIAQSQVPPRTPPRRQP